MEESKVRQIFQEELREYFENSPVAIQAKDHFLHHQHVNACLLVQEERAKNHSFVSAVRKNVDTAEKGFFSRIGEAVFVLVVLGILAVIYLKRNTLG
jgi:uncharacterized FlgJ-related protein